MIGALNDTPQDITLEGGVGWGVTTVLVDLNANRNKLSTLTYLG